MLAAFVAFVFVDWHPSLFYDGVPPVHRKTHPAEPYLLAIAIVGCALLLRVPVWDVLGTNYPFLTFFPAVALASHLKGRTAGTVTALLSGAAANYFFIPPLRSFVLTNAAEIIGTAYFFCIAAVLIWSADRLQRARDEAESQRRLIRQTLASIGDGVISTDDAARVTFINAVAEALTGWSATDAVGRPITEVFRIVNEDTGEIVENPVTRVLRDGQIVGLANHTVLIGRDSRTVPIDDSGAPIRNADGRILGAVLVFRDISERRAAETRIRQTEQQLTQLAKSDVIGVLFGDIHGRIRDANNEFLRIIGRTRTDLESGGLSWREITPPEYRSAENHALNEAKERGACTPYEKEYVRPDGTRVPVLVGYILLEPERELSVAFIADLTERRKSEEALRRINDDLQLFTYGTSHDLKEPLRMVASYSQLLVRRYKGRLDGYADEYLSYIAQGVERMRALVDALLEYSRAGEVTHNAAMRASAEDAVRAALLSLKAAIDESGAVITYDSLPPVCVEPVHLSQVFQNLIGNAIKYSGSGQPRVQISAELRHGMCVFTVADNGMGIPREHQDRVFVVFHRLHGPERSGTGLGLSTCRRIVERYGGSIWVESEGEGKGSRFHFTLPASAEADGAHSD